jgi:tetratricopeptide repeat protein 21B
MNIQQPEKAIRAFNRALELQPDNPSLCSKIGRTLVLMHDYERAISYYEQAAKRAGGGLQLLLMHELVELYITLERYPAALNLLAQNERFNSDSKNPRIGVQQLQEDVKSAMLKARVQKAAGDVHDMKDTLTSALSIQNDLMQQLQGRSQDQRAKARRTLAKLNYELALYYKSTNKHTEALNQCNAALHAADSKRGNATDTDDDVQYSARKLLAELLIQKGAKDAHSMRQAQDELQQLAVQRPHDQDVSKMLSGIMFQGDNHIHATDHLANLLQQNPTAYDTLETMVRTLRRAGRLAEAPRWLQLAEYTNATAVTSAGYNYCVGLYNWYMHDITKALLHFNNARKNGVWGKKAITEMVEIYLNPDNQDVFSDLAEQKSNSRELAKHITEAQRLIGDLAAMGHTDQKTRLLNAYVRMAMKTPHSLAEAMEICNELFTEDQHYLPALLGKATIHMIKRDTSKAKKYCTTANKSREFKNSAQHWEAREKLRLILAEIQHANGKKDEARTLCEQILRDNQSCVKALMILGSINEQDGAYNDAVAKYELCWKFTNRKSPEAGYKLAFNYLKDKRYLQAIDICHQVLKIYPRYPRIREDILHRARENIRVPEE